MDSSTPAAAIPTAGWVRAGIVTAAVVAASVALVWLRFSSFTMIADSAERG
jgi:hypothetical protein